MFLREVNGLFVIGQRFLLMKFYQNDYLSVVLHKNRHHMTLRFFILFFFVNIVLLHSQTSDKPTYKIEAQLDTSNNVLTVNTKIEIPESLGLPKDTIWFHLWANAYSNTNNDFTKEQLSFGNSTFYFSKESKLSKVSSLMVKSGNQSLSHVFKDEGQEILGVIIKDISSFSGNISFEYKLKLPYLKDGLGYRKEDYFLRNFYPKLAIYEGNEWQVGQHRQFDDEQGYKSDLKLKLTTPGGFDFYSNGLIKLDDYFVTITATGILDLTVTIFKNKKRNISGLLQFPNHKSVPYDIVVIDSILYNDSLEKIVVGLEKSFMGMSEKIGPYPYEKLTILIGEKCVNCFLSDGLIMEKAPDDEEVLSEYTASLLSAIWVRGSFDISSVRHTWIERGLVAYYYEKYARDYEVADVKTEFNYSFIDEIYRNQRYRTVPSLNSSQNENSPEYDWVRRMNKSGGFFMYAEELAGEENFAKVLTSLSENKKRLTPDVLIKSLDDLSEKQVARPLNTYVYGNPMTDYAILGVREDDGFYTILMNNDGQDSLPFILFLKENNGTEMEYFVDGRMGNFVVKTDIKSLDSIKIISVDKSGLLPEINRENNHFFPQRNSHRGKVKMVGLLSDGDSRVRELRFMVAPAYNDNDGFMLGASFSNSNENDPKPFRYAITPFYSFVNQKLLGQAWASFSHFTSQNQSISNIEFRIGVKSFDMDRNRSLDYAQRYIRIDPTITIHFKHSGNKVKRSSLALKSFLISEEYPEFDQGKYLGIQNQNSFINRMEYSYNAVSTLSSSGFRITLEQQSYTPIEKKENYLKLTAIFDQRYMYAKNKNIYFRGFASGFIINTQRESGGFQNGLTKGSIALIHQGHNDYTYDEYFFSRQNQNRTYDNFTSLTQGGGFKTPIGSAFGYGSSNNLAMAANISFDLPILPDWMFLRGYFDIGSFSTYESISQDKPELKEFRNNVMYNAGLSFNAKDLFAIHIPFIFSEELGNLYKGQHQSFLNRISFSLNLHKLDFWNARDPFED